MPPLSCIRTKYCCPFRSFTAHSGIYFPDEGQIYIHGKPATIASPKDAFRYGIGMIHQHFKLVDVMTAKENIIIGQPSGFFVKGKLLSQEVKKTFRSVRTGYRP